jgi:hypothetical protein
MCIVTRAKYIDSVGKSDKNMLLREEKTLRFLMLHNKNISVTLSKKNKKGHPVTDRD